MKKLIKELQERNREVIQNYKWVTGWSQQMNIEAITAQTVQATKEWVKEIVDGERRNQDENPYNSYHNQALDEIIKKLDI